MATLYQAVLGAEVEVNVDTGTGDGDERQRGGLPVGH